MDLKWITVTLLFSAVCGVSAYVPHRYHVVKEDKPWTEAQSYCRHLYTDLATINNMEEMNKLRSTFKDKPSGSAWIGLGKVNTGKWLWSRADGKSYKEGEAYRHWGSTEPNNSSGKEYCVAMLKSGKIWFDDQCDKQFTLVCLGKKTNSERHVFISETKTWFDAQRYCRENHTDLASVRNQTENEQIWDLVNSSSSGGVWIGLFYDSWEWSDQSTSSFRYWSSGPDEYGQSKKCAAVSVTDQGYWNDQDCSKTLPFICHLNQLILVQQNLTWGEALRYCRVKHVDLVSVHSEEIQLWVKEATQNASTEHVWVGLRHTCTLGFWFWVSGESICYENWAPGNGTGEEDCSPVERTGAVQSGGKQWVSLHENHTLNFICTTYEG